MRDITNKNITLRFAKACAYLYCTRDVLLKVENNQVPKGNIFELSKSAGMLACKKTAELIPHCHIVSIDFLTIDYKLLKKESTENFFHSSFDSAIYIEVEAKSIGRTGIEMEVLTTASVVALVLYDLLKPFNQAMEISGIQLLEKKGGKSDPKFAPKPNMSACILVCSDSTATGKREDSSGKIIQEILESYNIRIYEYAILPDEPEQIREKVKHWASQNVTYIFTTGGTGLGPRDSTIEAIRPILEREIPGISETMRNYGTQRTPWAMLSRSIAGSIGKTLVITLPGSSNGAKESLEAIIPGIFHARKMLKGGGHT